LEAKKEMSNLFDKIMDGLKKFSENLANGDTGSKTCGIPKLDILFKPINDTNTNTHIVILRRKKTPQIESFITAYKRAASEYGKVFFNNFAKYPSGKEEDDVYEAFEDIHILRADDYSLGIAGWLPKLPLQYTSFIASQAHPMLHDAAFALAKENGSDSHSINVSPAHVVVAAWMKKCDEIFDNLPKVFETKQPIKVYYKGDMLKLSIFFFFFLSRLGCNVLIEPDPYTDIDTLLLDLPQYIKIDVV
jgi:hypothetical protein